MHTAAVCSCAELHVVVMHRCQYSDTDLNTRVQVPPYCIVQNHTHEFVLLWPLWVSSMSNNAKGNKQ